MLLSSVNVHPHVVSFCCEYNCLFDKHEHPTGTLEGHMLMTHEGTVMCFECEKC